MTLSSFSATNTTLAVVQHCTIIMLHKHLGLTHTPFCHMRKSLLVCMYHIVCRLKNCHNVSISCFDIFAGGATSSPGPGSDSGLSGLEVNSKKASSPAAAVEEDSIADSGRRSQSLEILSDDLRSMTLSSTPSSSPSPRLASSQATPAPPGANKGHVHFMSVDNGTLNNPADIVRSMVTETELG